MIIDDFPLEFSTEKPLIPDVDDWLRKMFWDEGRHGGTMRVERRDLDLMWDWAEGVMTSREPDVDIGPGYLHRWHVIPKNKCQNIYLHNILRDDPVDTLHDHPWASLSIIIRGSYRDITEDEVRMYGPGSVITRDAHDRHRLELEDKSCLTLFFTSVVERDWGFWCHGEDGVKFKHYQQYHQDGGCGES